MNPLHNGPKGSRPLITFCTFLILSSLYFISTALTSLPSTYAWFTSETSASGTIQNATTEEMLQIGPSDITYGDDCSIEHSLTVKNISDMSTKVTISLQSGSGEVPIISQKLKPGESFKTAPEAISDSRGECEATSVDYHIKGFINYVNETYSVAVDPEKMIQPIVPQPEETKVEEKAKEQDETKVDKPEKAEPKEEAAETDGKSKVVDEEKKAVPPAVEEPEQKDDEPADTPQIEEDASSKAQPEEKVIEEANEDKQVEDVKEEQSEQAKAIAGE